MQQPPFPVNVSLLYACQLLYFCFFNFFSLVIRISGLTSFTMIMGEGKIKKIYVADLQWLIQYPILLFFALVTFDGNRMVYVGFSQKKLHCVMVIN